MAKSVPLGAMNLNIPPTPPSDTGSLSPNIVSIPGNAPPPAPNKSSCALGASAGTPAAWLSGINIKELSPSNTPLLLNCTFKF